MQSHVDVTSFHIKPTYKYFDRTVVVGRATPLAAKEVPHVIPLAVPLSFILKTKVSPALGVPLKFVVIDVIAAANAVIVTTSVLSVFIVGVAEEANVVILGVFLLFVNVCVAVVPTRLPAGGAVAQFRTVPDAVYVQISVSVIVFRLTVFVAVNVLPSAIVSVALDAGAVIVTLLIVVAVAAPREGVVKAGLVANTAAPDPVSSVNAPDNAAELKLPKDVALPTDVIAPVKFAFVVATTVHEDTIPRFCKAVQASPVGSVDDGATPKKPTPLKDWFFKKAFDLLV
jgi:hypothetical protein